MPIGPRLIDLGPEVAVQIQARLPVSTVVRSLVLQLSSFLSLVAGVPKIATFRWRRNWMVLQTSCIVPTSPIFRRQRNRFDT